MEDGTGQCKTINLCFTGLSLSGHVHDYHLSLHSEGRGHRFEFCRVHHQPTEKKQLFPKLQIPLGPDLGATWVQSRSGRDRGILRCQLKYQLFSPVLWGISLGLRPFRLLPQPKLQKPELRNLKQPIQISSGLIIDQSPFHFISRL